jgi:predicted acyl esterase
MLIEWDVEIPADDGVVLRADIFRPEGPEPAPAILTYGPYGKGLAYQDGYPDQWRILTETHPEVLEGRRTPTRTGRQSTPSASRRTGTPAFASIPAAPVAHRAS